MVVAASWPSVPSEVASVAAAGFDWEALMWRMDSASSFAA